LKVTTEKTENREVYLTIELAAEEVEASTQATYRRLLQRVSVPGFRKGKAPQPVLVRHIGADAFLTEVIEEAVPDAYDKAIEEQELDPVGRPRIELVEREPVIFKAIVPLKPVVTLGNYQKTRLKPEKVEVTEERIDAVIEELRSQWGTWEPVERTVALSDVASLDVESTIDGEPFINQQGAQFQVTGGSSAPAPGFAEEIVGMKAGDEKEFTLPFAEDDARSEVAGKKATFKVTVTGVKEEKLPEVDDEFAAKVEPDLKTIAELRTRVQEDLVKRADERMQGDFEEKVIDAVVECSEVEYPHVLVEVECQRMMEDQTDRMRMQGLSMEQFLRGSGKTEEEFHEELHPLAEKRLVRGLVLGKVAEDEDILITADDIDAEIEEMLKDHDDDRKAELRAAFGSVEARESVGQRLLSRRTVGRLTELAQGAKKTAAATKEKKPKAAKPKAAKAKDTGPSDAEPKQEEQS
jgi:trigger factor